MFHRIFDDGLAHSSYVIGCDRTRHAAIVDARRDIDAYVSFARRYGLTLTHAIDTHIHADYVSGARELSARGLTAVAGPGANLQFKSHEARDGEMLPVGDVSLRVMHTPGHTPEHISLLVDVPGEVTRVLTGDTLFVHAVGRPDLLGPDRARPLAEDLYTSLFHTLLALPDGVEVHPAHGAGSLCGSGIGRELHSTIGQERQFNPMLQHSSEDAFVEAVLRDLPETPPYFVELKRVNQRGPTLLDLGEGMPALAALSSTDAAEAVRQGAILLDVRAGDAFADGHPTGAINIGFGAKVGYWAGWMIPLFAQIVIVANGDSRQLDEVRRQLLRVGIDRVIGHLDGGFPTWRAAGLPVTQLAQIAPRELHERAARRLTIVDVRSPAEFETGHIPGALHIPIERLAAHVAEIPRHLPVATICEGGYRSTLAASLLARAGFTLVGSVSGGMSSYRSLAATTSKL